VSGYILGAYAAAPADLAADSEDERKWFSALAAEPLVGGLELPFDGGLNPQGADHLTRLLDPTWKSVVTGMSGISSRLLVDRDYGLASIVHASRRQAIADIAAARVEISKVRSALGPESIFAIQLQSAPGSRASAVEESIDAFSRSLVEIASWDWEGLAISVEHCDSPSGVRPPQKGFLSMEDEVRAVHSAREQSGIAIGHTINWARSTIESRDPETPVRQVASLAQSGTLVGLMFTGVAPKSTVFGGEWADAHLPVSDAGEGSEPLSLLTIDRIADTRRAAAGTQMYVGAKVSAPKIELPLLDRLVPGIATLRALAETDAQ
jgi:hypothetical protein